MQRLPHNLTESRERYRAVVEQAAEGIYILDTQNGRIVETNPALEEMVCVVVRDVTERKKTEEALREIREAERNRIARDLHDGALQDLTYALAETRHVLSAPEDPELDGRLGRAVEALERMGPELRGAIYDLRVEEERNKPLAEWLQNLVELNRIMNPDLDIRLNVDDSSPAKPLGEKSAELLRVLQEALTNVRRHSGARNATVSLMVEGGLLVAEVADDGRGFDPAVGSTVGMGTRGMRERARSLKGDLKIESEPGKGTKVRFEIPLKRKREEPEEEILVLLVEDHASFRQAAASVFEREVGFEVVGSHVIMMSQPQVVTEAILTALAAVSHREVGVPNR